MQTLFVCLIRGRIIVVLFLILSVCTHVKGQIKWDGEAGDGLWNTSGNWVGNIVPSVADDVVLDHSVITGNYTVTLPPGMAAVTVRTLTIFPAVPQTIEVLLPVANTAIPGFTAIGSVYGLVIHSGGIFRNSSGASAGTPVNISDSIKINNGGMYIHNTSRAHTTNVIILSKAAGTEQGTFEFDVPGGSGYTVSIAGRVYGNLVLSASAAGGTKSYTSTGITTVNINGQFKINPGVNYSLNFNGGFIIHGDFMHQGNIFDISSGPHNNLISVRKNMSQSGIITESGTGLPAVQFEGNANQNISVTGTITESITVRINNAAGVRLQTPVSISYKMELVNGKINTTSTNILVIQDNALCTGGSPNSFIEGPMKKKGDDNFDFPVGRQADYGPVSISGTGGLTTDEFEAEYFLGNPVSIFGSAFENPPIIRISRLEYWSLQRTVGTASKKITLSVRTYSNATLLEKLVVSRWDIPGTIWRSERNTAYAGIASGTVTSADVYSFGIFTLASTVVDQNPLPLPFISFGGRNQHGNVLLSWQLDPSLEPINFEILKSDDNIHFAAVKKIVAAANQRKYQFFEKLLLQGVYYYKLKVAEKNGGIRFSNVTSISYQQNGIELVSTSPLITHNTITFTVSALKKASINLYIINAEGKTVRKISTVVHNGSVNLIIDISTMPAGMYYLTGIGNGMKTNVIRVVKL